MASRYYGINKGQTKKDVVEGSSTNSTGIELVVDLAAVTATSKGQEEVLQALDYIRAYIMSKKLTKWPPA